MKKTLLTIGAVATGFILYNLFKKRYRFPATHEGFETKHQVANHHLTNAFAKAKKTAVTQD